VAVAKALRPRRRAHRRPRTTVAPHRPVGRRAGGCFTHLRPPRGGRTQRGDRTRTGTARCLERVLRLPTRSGWSSRRAVFVRLLHRRSRPQADPLVGERSALPLVLGHARARQLVRGVKPLPTEDSAVDERDQRSEVLA
jgi:hypothetical protein